MLPFALLLFSVLLSGCQMFTYDLTPPSASAVASVHEGTDCGSIIMGLGAGDLSLARAMKNGGITTPSKIMITQSWILVEGQNCIVVQGDGPGVPKKYSR